VSETFGFEAADGTAVHCYRWLPEDPSRARAIVHIAHGMGEHAARYDAVGRELAARDFIVVAGDHRGHGRTATTLGRFGEDGWNRALDDLRGLIASHRENWPGKPVFLLGHSMGAMMTQHYITRYGETIDGAVLSGSPGRGSWLQGAILRLLVWFERWRLGADATSPLLEQLVFGSANKAFEAEASDPTGFEWLSRDPDQVRAYVDDPLGGFVPCTGSLHDIFSGNREALGRDAIGRIPRKLPLYVFAGTSDPVNNDMKNIDRLLARYRERGLEITTRFYPEGRHEMLNETNRTEVIGDLIDWLEGHTRGQ